MLNRVTCLLGEPPTFGHTRGTAYAQVSPCANQNRLIGGYAQRLTNVTRAPAPLTTEVTAREAQWIAVTMRYAPSARPSPSAASLSRASIACA
jgi:hypothetical protein